MPSPCQAILYNSAQVSSGQSYIFNAIISVGGGGVLPTGGIVLGTIAFAIVNQGIYYTGFDANSAWCRSRAATSGSRRC